MDGVGAGVGREAAIVQYLGWFNDVRLHESL
jgi:hypothetical protein